MKKIKYFYVAVAFFAILGLTAGCKKISADSSSLYTPTTANITSKATLAELQQGRTLFMSMCSNCHGLYSPDAYSVSQWKTILNNMAPRTGMSSAQVLLVTKYVCKGNQ